MTLREIFYPKLKKLLSRVAHFLHSKKITPNQLTLAGLLLSFIAGLFYAKGLFVIGALILIVGASTDMLDGVLARETNQATPFGAFFDSTIDRYTEFFIFGGLSLYFARENQVILLLITLGTLMGSILTSYAKARAENIITDCTVGIFDRALRIVMIIVGTLLPFLLPIALWILFLGCNITALQRIYHTYKNTEPANS